MSDLKKTAKITCYKLAPFGERRVFEVCEADNLYAVEYKELCRVEAYMLRQRLIEETGEPGFFRLTDRGLDVANGSDFEEIPNAR